MPPNRSADQPQPRMRAAERRDQLLDLLEELILSEGYASISIDRLAREAGIARTVIYAQFDNLDAMHAALADRGEQRIFAQVHAAIPDLSAVGDPDEVVVQALGRFLDGIAREPKTWRLALLPQDGAPIALRERVTRNRAAVVSLLTPVCAAAIDRRGGPADIDPEILAHVILASSEQAGRILLEQPGPQTRERLVKFTRSMLSAISAAPHTAA